VVSAIIRQGLVLEIRHPRTIGATMCLVWNIWEHSRELSCWICETGIAIPTGPSGARGDLRYGYIWGKS
jgi:hypothetical protein